MENTTELRHRKDDKSSFFNFQTYCCFSGLVAFDLLPFEPYHNVHDANDNEKIILSGLLFPRDWLCQLVMWLQEVLSVSTSLFFMCFVYLMGIKNFFP